MLAPRCSIRSVIIATITALSLSACGIQLPAISGNGAPTTKSDTSASPSRQVTIIGTGDFLIHNTLWQQAASDGGGTLDFRPQVEGVKPLIKSADVAFCHQDTPFAKQEGPYIHHPLFNTPPQLATAIASAGFDSCSISSNHSLDRGYEGVVRTIETLEKAGVNWAGSARSAEEANTPRIIERNGVKFAHLAYTDAFNGIPEPQGKPWCCNKINVQRILNEAKRSREAGAEIIVLTLHAGTEDQAAPTAFQKETAGQLAASGLINIVYGVSTHVVQPVEKIGDMWIAYGLGNLLSGQLAEWRRNREGAAVEFSLKEESPGQFKVIKGKGFPIFNEYAPSRLVNVIQEWPKRGPNTRWKEAYDHTRRTLLSEGAGKYGFTVPPLK